MQKDPDEILEQISGAKKRRKVYTILGAAVLIFLIAGGGVLYKLKYEDWKMVWLAKKHENGQTYLYQYYEAKKEIKNNPDNADTYLSLGIAQQELGDNKRAEKALLKSFALNSGNINTINSLASFYLKTKNFPKAEEYYLKALDIESKNISAYQNLVSFYFNDYAEKNREIEKIILRGLSEMPDDQNLLAMLASYYMAVANDRGKAIEIYQKILLLRPSDELLRREIERLKNVE